MHILFDGYWWVHGPTSNQNVLRGIVTTWSQQFPDDRLSIALPARDAEPPPPDLPAGMQIVRTRLRPHAFAAMFEMPRLARRVGADVVFNHNFAALCRRSAVFLHDVIFQTNPEWFTRRERMYFALMPLSLRRASLVLTSTDAEGARVRRANPHAPRIATVGIAPTPQLVGSRPVAPPGYESLREFYLCVGRFNPRKNLSVTLEAAVASGILTPEQPLVIVGEGEHHTIPLSDEARSAADRGLIKFLRFVPDEQLAWLYQHARLMLFMSLDEGFGLPPVEALALGCPVLVSDIAVFHETMNDHAVYADPHDQAAVAKMLQQIAATGPDHTPYLRTTWEDSVRRIRAEFIVLTG